MIAWIYQPSFIQTCRKIRRVDFMFSLGSFFYPVLLLTFRIGFAGYEIWLENCGGHYNYVLGSSMWECRRCWWRRHFCTDAYPHCWVWFQIISSNIKMQVKFIPISYLCILQLANKLQGLIPNHQQQCQNATDTLLFDEVFLIQVIENLSSSISEMVQNFNQPS